MVLLEVENLSISSGGLKAIDDFQIGTDKGQLYGLIGPSGTGKVTAFNLFTGIYEPDAGSIGLDNVNVTGRRTTEIDQAEIARTFQNICLFKDLSVLDSVKVRLYNHYRYSTVAGISRLPRYYKIERQVDEKAMELLRVFGLGHGYDYKAFSLPYGKQRKLEIAKALATRPKLPLLNEPVTSMNLNETAEPVEAIRFVQDNFGMTILLTKYDMKLVSGIREELTMLNFGQILCQGETGMVLYNPEVIKAYLGE